MPLPPCRRWCKHRAPRRGGALTAEKIRGGGGLGFLLVQAAQKWRNEVAAALEDQDVTPPQFFVLMTLLHAQREGTPLNQREVSLRTRMDANTTSQVVRTLEARGLVGRATHPDDSRAVALSLSGDGLETAHACSQRTRAVNARFFRSVDARTLASCLKVLLE